MNITEMIIQLEKLKEKHGDLPVYIDQEKIEDYSFLKVKNLSKTRLYRLGSDPMGIPPEELGYVITIDGKK